MRDGGQPTVEEILRSIKNVMVREPRRSPAHVGADPETPPGDETAESRLDEDDQAAAHASGEAGENAALAADGAAFEPADGDEADDILELTTPARPGAQFIAPDEDDDGEEDDREYNRAHYHGAAARDPDGLIEADGGSGTDAGPDAGTLTTAAAAASMRESLAALAMLAEPGAPLPTTGAGKTALAELVRELLRPMLAEWLEGNLPAIVEREVRAEISRITGARG